MTHKTGSPDLPEYSRPPVAETVLGVQFEELPNFKSAHLGAYWKTLSSNDWPVVDDASLLPQQFETFAESEKWLKGIRVQVTSNPSSRLQIKSKSADRMIQLQNGRLHYNWLGAGDGEYPRYNKVKAGFSEELQRLTEFLEQNNIGKFQPNQWEVTYVNHIPKGTVWNAPDEWTFFRPIGSVPTFDALAEGESFTGEWHFVIPEQKGRLHVHWQHAKKNEPDQTAEEFVRLTLTARGPLPTESESQGVFDGLDLGHETIVRSFKEFMTDSANEFWGLKNG